MLVVFVQCMEMILKGQIDPTRCYEGCMYIYLNNYLTGAFYILFTVQPLQLCFVIFIKIYAQFMTIYNFSL